MRSYLFSQFNAEISINTDVVYGNQVSPLSFGCFFEYSDYNMLGANGLLAQELNNRGFDTGDSYALGAPDRWLPYNSNTNQKIKIIPGGYNPNGKFYMNLENNNEGEFGIMQKVWLDRETDYTFYLYSREKSTRGEYRLLIRLLDSESKTLLNEFELPKCDSQWKKLELTIPAIKGLFNCYLVICVQGNCDLDIDETSLIASNHKFQLRNSYYEMLKQWKPGIVRYPGGCFSDTRAHHLDYAIGDINRRESPNYYSGITQRMEFGYDEFMMFCESLNAEPHLVLNMVFGSPTEAANTVEYFNSPENTFYGQKRALGGRVQPYNVKYWEIGNEQWDNPPQMTKNYLEMYHAMTEKDPSILCMVDGDIWGGEEFFHSIYNTIGSNCNVYSWHLASGYDTRIGNTELETYIYLVGCGVNYRTYHNILADLISSLPFEQKLGITELWTAYNDGDYDNHPRHYTLERGLWLASMMMNILKHDSFTDIVETTWNSGMVKTSYTKDGERVYLASPSMHSLLMLRRNTGYFKYFTNTISPVYSVKLNMKYYEVENVPWIESLVTGDSNYLYIAVLNRHYSDYCSLKIVINDSLLSFSCDGEILTSNHYLDSCTAEKPELVTAKKTNFEIIDGITVIPPLTFTIAKVNRNLLNFNPKTKPKSYVVPNINTGIFIVLLKHDATVSVEKINIFDSIGKLVKSMAVPSNLNQYSMDCQDLPKGMYFMKLTERNEIIPFLISY